MEHGAWQSDREKERGFKILERVEKRKETLLRENEKLKVERGKTVTQQVFPQDGHQKVLHSSLNRGYYSIFPGRGIV